MTVPGSTGIGPDDMAQAPRQCKCAGLIVPSGTPGPAQNIEVTSTAP